MQTSQQRGHNDRPPLTSTRTDWREIRGGWRDIADEMLTAKPFRPPTQNEIGSTKINRPRKGPIDLRVLSPDIPGRW
jgi:hypothetical protein